MRKRGYWDRIDLVTATNKNLCDLCVLGGYFFLGGK